MTLEEYKKKKQQNSTQNNTSAVSGGNTVYNTLYQKTASLVNSSEGMYTAVNQRYGESRDEERNYNTATQWYDKVAGYAKPYQSQYEAIRQEIEKSRTSLTDEQYKQLTEALDNDYTNVKKVLQQADEDKKYYANYASYDDLKGETVRNNYAYNRSIREQAEEAEKTVDLDELERTIVGKREELSQLDRQEQASKKSYSRNSGTEADTAPSIDYEKYQTLEREISTLETQYNTEARKQRLAELESTATSASDFRRTAAGGRDNTAIRIAESQSVKNTDNAVYANLTEMSNSEKQIYSYWYATDKEKAKEYLDLIQERLNQRRGEYLAENRSALTNAIGAGMSQSVEGFKGGVQAVSDLVTGNRTPTYTPVSASQYAYSIDRENQSGIAKVGLDIVENAVNQLPQIITNVLVGNVAGALGASAGVASKIGQIAGNVVMGFNAGGNAYAELTRAGYTPQQARTMGVITGLSETMLGELLNGVVGAGVGVAVKGGTEALKAGLATAIGKATGKAFAKGAVNLLGEMAGEFLEESMQDILEPVFKQIATGEKAEWEDGAIVSALYSGLIGALSAGAMNTVTLAGNHLYNVSEGVYGKNEKTIRQLLKEATSQEERQELLRYYTEKAVNDTQKEAMKAYTENLTKMGKSEDVAGYFTRAEKARTLYGDESTDTDINTIAKTVKANNLLFSTEAENALKQSLVRQGFTERDANTYIANFMAMCYMGERVNEAIRNIVAESEEFANALNETVTNGKPTVRATPTEPTEPKTDTPNPTEPSEQQRAEDEQKRQAIIKDLADIVTGEADGGNPSENDIGREEDIETPFTDVEKEDEADIETPFTDVEDSKEPSADVEEKVPFEVEDIDQEAVRRNEAIDRLTGEGISDKTALSIAKMTDGTNDTDIVQSAITAYKAGEMGIPFERVGTGKGSLIQVFTEDRAMLETAYNEGATKRKARYSPRQAEMQESYNNREEEITGRLTLDESIDRSKLTEEQKDQLAVLEYVAKYVIATPIRVINDSSKPNGSFRRDFGVVLNLDGKYKGNEEGTVLWAGAHEFTHLIAEYNPQGFEELCDVLFRYANPNYRKVTGEIKAEYSKAGIELDEYGVREEYACRCMEGMLTDKNAVEKLEKVAEKERGIVPQVLDWLKRFAEKLKAIAQKFRRNSAEARSVYDMGKKYSELAEKWREELVRAGQLKGGVTEERRISRKMDEMWKEYNRQNAVDETIPESALEELSTDTETDDEKTVRREVAEYDAYLDALEKQRQELLEMEQEAETAQEKEQVAEQLDTVQTEIAKAETEREKLYEVKRSSAEEYGRSAVEYDRGYTPYNSEDIARLSEKAEEEKKKADEHLKALFFGYSDELLNMGAIRDAVDNGTVPEFIQNIKQPPVTKKKKTEKKKAEKAKTGTMSEEDKETLAESLFGKIVHWEGDTPVLNETSDYEKEKTKGLLSDPRNIFDDTFVQVVAEIWSWNGYTYTGKTGHYMLFEKKSDVLENVYIQLNVDIRSNKIASYLPNDFIIRVMHREEGKADVELYTYKSQIGKTDMKGLNIANKTEERIFENISREYFQETGTYLAWYNTMLRCVYPESENPTKKDKELYESVRLFGEKVKEYIHQETTDVEVNESGNTFSQKVVDTAENENGEETVSAEEEKKTDEQTKAYLDELEKQRQELLEMEQEAETAQEKEQVAEQLDTVQTEIAKAEEEKQKAETEKPKVEKKKAEKAETENSGKKAERQITNREVQEVPLLSEKEVNKEQKNALKANKAGKLTSRQISWIHLLKIDQFLDIAKDNTVKLKDFHGLIEEKLSRLADEFVALYRTGNEKFSDEKVQSAVKDLITEMFDFTRYKFTEAKEAIARWSEFGKRDENLYVSFEAECSFDNEYRYVIEFRSNARNPNVEMKIILVSGDQYVFSESAMLYTFNEGVQELIDVSALEITREAQGIFYSLYTEDTVLRPLAKSILFDRSWVRNPPSEKLYKFMKTRVKETNETTRGKEDESATQGSNESVGTDGERIPQSDVYGTDVSRFGDNGGRDVLPATGKQGESGTPEMVQKDRSEVEPNNGRPDTQGSNSRGGGGTGNSQRNGLSERETVGERPVGGDRPTGGERTVQKSAESENGKETVSEEEAEIKKVAEGLGIPEKNVRETVDTVRADPKSLTFMYTYLGNKADIEKAKEYLGISDEKTEEGVVRVKVWRFLEKFLQKMSVDTSKVTTEGDVTTIKRLFKVYGNEITSAEAEEVTKILDKVFDELSKSQDVKQKAQANNYHDFQMTVYDDIENALTDSYNNDTANLYNIILGNRDFAGKLFEGVMQKLYNNATAQKQSEVQQKEQEARAENTSVAGDNHVIAEDFAVTGSKRQKIRSNIEAIRIAIDLRYSYRSATNEEKEALARYVGWGGLQEVFGLATVNHQLGKKEFVPHENFEREYEDLRSLVDNGVLTEEEYASMRRSVTTAFYTPMPVIKAMYGFLEKCGFTGGKILEPSCGVGRFAGGLPESMRENTIMSMVELDPITGQIAKTLYPSYNVQIDGFENTRFLPNSFDVVTGNVPFDANVKIGYTTVLRENNKPHATSVGIDKYFLLKSIDLLREGGIAILIAPPNGLRVLEDNELSYEIARKVDFLGAVRLPNGTFKQEAGTETGAIVYAVQKRTLEEEEAVRDREYALRDASRSLNRSARKVNGEDVFDYDYSRIIGYRADKYDQYGNDIIEYAGTAEELGEELSQKLSAFVSAIPPVNTAKDDELRTLRALQYAKENKNKGGTTTGYALKSDGTLTDRQLEYDGIHANPQIVEVAVTAERMGEEEMSRVRGMLQIANAYDELATAMRRGLDAKQLDALRGRLNSVYDGFVEKYGYISGEKNKAVMQRDISYNKLLEMEVAEGAKGAYRKADIFRANTVHNPESSINNTKGNIHNALIATMTSTGGYNIGEIARLYGKTVEETERDLVANGLAYYLPGGGTEDKVKYLSGYIRQKLAQAKEASKRDRRFEQNVKDLEAICPTWVDISQIDITPLSSCMPAEIPAFFCGGYKAVKNSRTWKYDIVQMERQDFPNFSPAYGSLDAGQYRINAIVNALKNNVSQIDGIYRNDPIKASAEDIVKDFLGIAGAEHESETRNGQKVDGATLLRHNAIIKSKTDALKEEFRKYILNNGEIVRAIEQNYNNTFNSYVAPKYTGEWLTLPGLSPKVTLREHQKKAIERILREPSTLLNHGAGAGKTAVMVSACMKMKELGLVQRPLIVAPKNIHITQDREFMKFYPGAKILTATAKDFTPEGRERFLYRMINGDWDCVLLSYQQFEAIPLSRQTHDSYISRIMSETELLKLAGAEREAGKNGVSAKKLASVDKSVNTAQNILEKGSSKKKDNIGITFEDLMIDFLCIDEAHHFKNLYTATGLKLPGLTVNSQTGRSIDLLLKTMYMRDTSATAKIVLATATPVVNSMTEIYTVMRYLYSTDELRNMGVGDFDMFVSNFAERNDVVQINSSATGYEMKSKFNRFKNLPELQRLFSGVNDYVEISGTIQGVPKHMRRVMKSIPESQQEYKGDSETGVLIVLSEATPRQEQTIKNNYELLKTGEIKGLEATRRARALSHGMPVLYPDGEPLGKKERGPIEEWEEDGKVSQLAKCVNEMYTDYPGKTQIVFVALGVEHGKVDYTGKLPEYDTGDISLYQHMVNEFRRNGVRGEDIAIIQSTMSETEREEIMGQVNDGKKRVLIGSYDLLSEGLNVQKNIIAIHQFAPTYTPASVEQARRRAYRQGNDNDEVLEIIYETKGTYDAKLWELISNKDKFIRQVMRCEAVGRSMGGDGEIELSLDDLASIASGIPYAGERASVSGQIQSARGVYEGAVAEKVTSQQRVRKAKETLQGTEQEKEMFRRIQSVITDEYTEDTVRIVTEDGEYRGIENVTDAIKPAFEQAKNGLYGSRVYVGKLCGLDLTFETSVTAASRDAGVIARLTLPGEDFLLRTASTSTGYGYARLSGLLPSILEAVKAEYVSAMEKTDAWFEAKKKERTEEVANSERDYNVAVETEARRKEELVLLMFKTKAYEYGGDHKTSKDKMEALLRIAEKLAKEYTGDIDTGKVSGQWTSATHDWREAGEPTDYLTETWKAKAKQETVQEKTVEPKVEETAQEKTAEPKVEETAEPKAEESPIDKVTEGKDGEKVFRKNDKPVSDDEHLNYYKERCLQNALTSDYVHSANFHESEMSEEARRDFDALWKTAMDSEGYRRIEKSEYPKGISSTVVLMKERNGFKMYIGLKEDGESIIPRLKIETPFAKRSTDASVVCRSACEPNVSAMMSNIYQSLVNDNPNGGSRTSFARLYEALNNVDRSQETVKAWTWTDETVEEETVEEVEETAEENGGEKTAIAETGIQGVVNVSEDGKVTLEQGEVKWQGDNLSVVLERDFGVHLENAGYHADELFWNITETDGYEYAEKAEIPAEYRKYLTRETYFYKRSGLFDIFFGVDKTSDGRADGEAVVIGSFAEEGKNVAVIPAGAKSNNVSDIMLFITENLMRNAEGASAGTKLTDMLLEADGVVGEKEAFWQVKNKKIVPSMYASEQNTLEEELAKAGISLTVAERIKLRRMFDTMLYTGGYKIGKMNKYAEDEGFYCILEKKVGNLWFSIGIKTGYKGKPEVLAFEIGREEKANSGGTVVFSDTFAEIFKHIPCSAYKQAGYDSITEALAEAPRKFVENKSIRGDITYRPAYSELIKLYDEALGETNPNEGTKYSLRDDGEGTGTATGTATRTETEKEREQRRIARVRRFLNNAQKRMAEAGGSGKVYTIKSCREEAERTANRLGIEFESAKGREAFYADFREAMQEFGRAIENGTTINNDTLEKKIKEISDEIYGYSLATEDPVAKDRREAMLQYIETTPIVVPHSYVSAYDNKKNGGARGFRTGTNVYRGILHVNVLKEGERATTERGSTVYDLTSQMAEYFNENMFDSDETDYFGTDDAEGFSKLLEMVDSLLDEHVPTVGDSFKPEDLAEVYGQVVEEVVKSAYGLADRNGVYSPDTRESLEMMSEQIIRRNEKINEQAKLLKQNEPDLDVEMLLRANEMRKIRKRLETLDGMVNAKVAKKKNLPHMPDFLKDDIGDWLASIDINTRAKSRSKSMPTGRQKFRKAMTEEVKQRIADVSTENIYNIEKIINEKMMSNEAWESSAEILHNAFERFTQSLERQTGREINSPTDVLKVSVMNLETVRYLNDWLGAVLDICEESQKLYSMGVYETATELGVETVQYLYGIGKSFSQELTTGLANAGTYLKNTKVGQIAGTVGEKVSNSRVGQAIGKGATVAKNAGAYAVNKTGERLDRLFNWENVLPSVGFERFGKAGQAINRLLWNADAKKTRLAEEVISFVKNTYTEKEVDAWEKGVIHSSTNPNITVTVAQAMALYEYMKQEGSVQHVLSERGGQGFRPAPLWYEGKKYEQEVYKADEALIRSITDQLTDRQIEVADRLQKYMETRGGELYNEITLARFGERLATELNYFSIYTDSVNRASEFGSFPPSASLYALINASFTKKRDVNANNPIVLYSIFDIFSSHMSAMIQYNAYALPILNIIRWANFTGENIHLNAESEINTMFRERDGQQGVMTEDGKFIPFSEMSVRKEMRRIFGHGDESTKGSQKSPAETFVENIIRSYNGTMDQGDTMRGESALRALRVANASHVAFNLSVAVKQPMSYIRSALVLSVNAMAHGLKGRTVAETKADIEEMKQYSAIASWKAMGFYSSDLTVPLAKKIKGETGILDKAVNAGMILPELADTVTWAAIWRACKYEAVNKYGLRAGTEEAKQKASEIMDEVIYKTQVVDTVMTRSEFMRSRKAVPRILSAFQAEPTENANMFIAVGDKWRMNRAKGYDAQRNWNSIKGDFKVAVLTHIVSSVVMAVTSSFIAGLRQDEEDKNLMEKSLSALPEALLDELMPFNKLPIASEVYSGLKHVINATENGKGNEDVFTVFDSSVNFYTENLMLLGDTIERIFKSGTGETGVGYTNWSALHKSLELVSSMSGIGISNAEREMRTLWNNTIGQFSPSLYLDTYRTSDERSWRYGRYLLSGNTSALAKIKAEYESKADTVSEGTAQYTSAMRNAVKGLYVEYGYDEQTVRKLLSGLGYSDNEIYWYLDDWNYVSDGGDDYRKYNAFLTAVATDNVQEVRAEAQRYITHGVDKSTLASQITSAYKQAYIDATPEERKQIAQRLVKAYAGIGYTTKDTVLRMKNWLK